MGFYLQMNHQSLEKVIQYRFFPVEETLLSCFDTYQFFFLSSFYSFLHAIMYAFQITVFHLCFPKFDDTRLQSHLHFVEFKELPGVCV